MTKQTREALDACTEVRKDSVEPETGFSSIRKCAVVKKIKVVGVGVPLLQEIKILFQQERDTIKEFTAK